MVLPEKKVKHLVVDTTAFIQNAQLQDIAENVITCQEVIDEITNKRQLRRLVFLPYDLIVKEVYPENIKVVTEFSKKSGDYPSLSATDIKVMALTYQLEKENVGIDHLRTEPVVQCSVNVATSLLSTNVTSDVVGFYMPPKKLEESLENTEGNVKEFENLLEEINNLECKESIEKVDEILVSEENQQSCEEEASDDDNDEGWITPSNIKTAKEISNSRLIEDKNVTVACITTDFAMQNVLKQMNLNVTAFDGRIIKQLRTFILRCYSCFKTTSIMTKQFCPKCGNNTLKKVAVSLDENGKMQIHINSKKPLSGRGKRFSLPRIKGGKHPNNPMLVADQPVPDNRPSRLASMKNNPFDDYIAGFSPFVTRDVNSRSAQLKGNQEIKYWMKKNPNEARRNRK